MPKNLSICLMISFSPFYPPLLLKIHIHYDEYKKADELAARLGMSRSELYRTAVAEFMAKNAEEVVTERLNERARWTASLISPVHPL